MKKHAILIALIVVTLSMAFSTSIAFGGYNNQNDDLPFAGKSVDRGTNKASNELPEQSNVPPPAGLLEALFGAANVTDGCRAGGGDVAIYEPGLGTVWGGPCCKGPMIEEGLYAPNQCCNPPDIIYTEEEYTPGNHCLCFVMRFDPWPPALP